MRKIRDWGYVKWFFTYAPPLYLKNLGLPVPYNVPPVFLYFIFVNFDQYLKILHYWFLGPNLKLYRFLPEFGIFLDLNRYYKKREIGMVVRKFFYSLQKIVMRPREWPCRKVVLHFKSLKSEATLFIRSETFPAFLARQPVITGYHPRPYVFQLFDTTPLTPF